MSAVSFIDIIDSYVVENLSSTASLRLPPHKWVE